MATKDVIDAMVDSIIEKLMDHASDLGNITNVYERDEDPAIALEAGHIPCAYIVPLIGGDSNIDMTMGGPQAIHDFGITLLAYYRMPDVNTSLRTVRGYGYDTLDLFRDYQSIDTGQLYNANVEFGYFTVVDVIVHWWSIGMRFKLIA